MHGDCVNLPGSHQCSCHPGFHKMVRHFLQCSMLMLLTALKTNISKESGECEDIDECSSSPCLGGSFPFSYVFCELWTSSIYSGSCTNLAGTFECSCEQGWRLENINLRSREKKLALPRLNGDTFECEDIDECAVENGGCHHTCVNTPGGVDCRSTFRFASLWNWISILGPWHLCLPPLVLIAGEHWWSRQSNECRLIAIGSI